jgi:hypothetical protein
MRNPTEINANAPLPALPSKQLATSSISNGSSIPEIFIRKAEEIFGNQGAASEDVRACAELIRARFRLEIEIYTSMNVVKVAILEGKKEESKNTLLEIDKMIRRWQFLKSQWSEKEWLLVEAINREMKVIMNPPKRRVHAPAPTRQIEERKWEEPDLPRVKGIKRFSLFKNLTRK